jgi:hypothetical protein
MAESTTKVKTENCNGILAFALLSLLCQQTKKYKNHQKKHDKDRNDL